MARLPRVTVHGAAPARTPTVLLTLDGRSPAELSEHLAGCGVNAPAGSFYAIEASRWLGLGAAGGVRVGLSPYSTADEVDRLLAGIAEMG